MKVIEKYIMQKAPKLFLFDFDGVIVDSLDIYEYRVKRSLEKIGQPMIHDRSDFLSLFADNFYNALVKKGVDLEQFMHASQEIPAEGDNERMMPYAAVLPVLKELGKENILAVISSNASDVIRNVLLRHNISGCFREIMGVDSGYSKTVKIRHALKRFEMAEDKSYYIGDTVGDIREGGLAGVRTVAVTWGWHTREMLENAKPDYLIDDARSLLELAATR